MRHDGPAGRAAQHLPLGPDGIDARAAQLTERIAAHIADVEGPDRASFLAVLRTRLDLTWLALEAAQAAVLQYGARGYLTGAETGAATARGAVRRNRHPVGQTHHHRAC